MGPGTVVCRAFNMAVCTSIPKKIMLVTNPLLMFVSDNPNVSQKELARMYGVSGATMAVSLKKLEKRGYIRRLVDQEDNRCNQICITDKGRKVVVDSVKIFRHIESRMFEGFSENDMKVLGELLDRIYGNLNQEFTDRAEREES